MLLLRKDFSTLELLAFGTLGLRILCCGGLSVYCRMFSSIPGLYPPDAINTPPTTTCDKQKYLQTLPNISWGKNCPWLKTNLKFKNKKHHQHEEKNQKSRDRERIRITEYMMDYSVKINN